MGVESPNTETKKFSIRDWPNLNFPKEWSDKEISNLKRWSVDVPLSDLVSIIVTHRSIEDQPFSSYNLAQKYLEVQDLVRESILKFLKEISFFEEHTDVSEATLSNLTSDSLKYFFLQNIPEILLSYSKYAGSLLLRYPIVVGYTLLGKIEMYTLIQYIIDNEIWKIGFTWVDFRRSIYKKGPKLFE